MRILVTGLDGFTGPYMESELVSHGHSVVGLSSDLTDADAVSREISRLQPEGVIHLAGISDIAYNTVNAFYDVNLVGTRNLLEALAMHALNVRSILLVSSAYVYGGSQDGVLHEDTALEPANDYAISRVAMEEMAGLWVDRLPLFIVRTFNYTGIGQDDRFLIPKIVTHFREKRRSIELGNLNVWREFGNVRVVVGVYRKLLEHCPVGKTLNVCTGQSYSLREVVTLCEKITGHKIEIQVNKKLIRENEVRELVGDNSRLIDIIGSEIPGKLEDTLRWMLNKDEADSE